ncbi:MAG: AAA family ATPase [Pseudobdellovibrionaceae bacterium]|nr:AAA family ATPase [Bdellovibrionales bacterium]USN46762.1 MAG: AAA family ATPase [Pseudobdellovibrionaceae bacterium]
MSGLLKLQKPKITRGVRDPYSQIIAVGGGKGGVGKSFLSSNLGIFLANMGFNTVLVDLDLGSANLHTCIGENLPDRGFDDLLLTDSKNLEDVLTTTKIPNLRIVTMADKNFNFTSLNIDKKSQLMSAIFNLKADFVILDLSAGIDDTTIDFFLMAQHQLIAVNPEPSSIENAYRFMKAAFLRKVKRFERQFDLTLLLQKLQANADKYQIRHPVDLLNQLEEHDPEAALALFEQLRKLEFKIVMNQTRTAKDAGLGHSIKSVSHKYFGLPTRFIGYLDYDNAVWQALRKRRPVVLESPQSRLYAQLMTIARGIVSESDVKKAG